MSGDSTAPARAPRGITVRRAIWLCLILQAVIGVAVVIEGSRGFRPETLFAPKAPRLAPGDPVVPDDQRRRYRPDDLPGMPVPRDGPSRDDLGDLGPMPERLLAQVALIDGQAVLTLTGTIDDGAAERVARVLDTTLTPPEEVHLHSPGGLVAESLAIGQMIRAAELPTRMEAGAVCLSACPYILAGGVERRVSVRASVGLHQSYYDSSAYLPLFIGVADVQRGEAEAMRYLIEMGVDPLIRIPALETPPADIYLLTPEELTNYRLATDLIDDAR